MVLGRDNAPGYTSNAPIGRRAKATAYRNALRNGTVFYNRGQESAAGMTNAYNTGGRRVTSDLLSIWWFTEGTGTVIEDRAGGTTVTDLTILSGTSWTQDASYGNRYFLNLSAGGHVQASTDELYKAMLSKIAAGSINEFSIEAWVKPTNVTQDGPARIITLAENGNGTLVANFMLGQGWWGSNPATVYDTRVRVTPSSIDPDGTDYQTPAGTATTNLQHLVLTVSGEPGGIASKLYVDGIEKIDETLNYYGTNNATNFLGNWSGGYKLDIGNTVTTPIGADRPWKGGIYLMSMYTRALLPGEVKTNYAAGVTTDSVLPVPSSKFDSPLSSTIHSDGTAVSIPFSVGGIRAANITCTYSVSSTALSSSEYTIDKDLTLVVGPNDLGDTVSITPKLTCSGDGIITAHLNSMSVGSPVAGDTSTYSLYVSSTDANTTFSGVGDRDIDTVGYGQLLPIAGTLSRKHRYDISATINLSAHAGNTGTYALVSSTMLVPSGTFGVSPYLLSAQAPALFVSGDSVRLSSTGASSDSSLATITASMNDLITFTNTPAGDKPGPGNTGYRGTYGDLKDPDGQPWWNSSKSLVTSSNAVIKGYKFSFCKVSDPSQTTTGVTFIDCLFDGGCTATGYVLQGQYNNLPRDVTLQHCEIKSNTGTSSLDNNGNVKWSASNLVSHLYFKEISYCNVWDSGADGFGSFKWEDGCEFKNNWLHQLGKTVTSHADGIQSVAQSEDNDLTIKDNYFDMRKEYLYENLGASSYVDNLHAPHIQDSCSLFSDSYKANQCIRIVAEGNSTTKVGYQIKGDITITGNWFAGWNSCIIVGDAYGKYDGSSVMYSNVVINSNRYERDFQYGNFVITAGSKFGFGGGVTHDTQTDVWDDTNEPIAVVIDYVVNQSGSAQEWNRYLCEQYGRCPAGTWDPNKTVVEWCCDQIV